MALESGALIHRITVQSKVETADPETGYRITSWSDRVVNEPAQYFAGPGREYLASDSLRAQVSGRFIIRWSPEAALIVAADRVLWDGRVMEVQAPPLPDETARKSLTLMVAESGTDGA